MAKKCENRKIVKKSAKKLRSSLRDIKLGEPEEKPRALAKLKPFWTGCYKVKAGNQPLQSKHLKRAYTE